MKLPLKAQFGSPWGEAHRHFVPLELFPFGYRLSFAGFRVNPCNQHIMWHLLYISNPGGWSGDCFVFKPLGVGHHKSRAPRENLTMLFYLAVVCFRNILFECLPVHSLTLVIYLKIMKMWCIYFLWMDTPRWKCVLLQCSGSRSFMTVLPARVPATLFSSLC